MHDYKRPPTLHRYAPRAELELSLKLGQFRLVPANHCLTLSFSQVWDKSLFEHLAPADCCLVSESGIRTRDDILRLQQAGVRAVLIGESLIRAPDIGAALDELRGA